jgi:hypothetical protein
VGEADHARADHADVGVELISHGAHLVSTSLPIGPQNLFHSETRATLSIRFDCYQTCIVIFA